ncbi:hypothetical protein ACFL5O_07965 [Myxococcota bacterium]
MRNSLGGLSGLAVLCLIDSCCEDFRLGVPDLHTRLAFGFDVAVQAKFDSDAQFEFDWDWAGWSRIHAVGRSFLDFDADDGVTFRARTTGDTDDDGMAEEVRLVALTRTDPAHPDRVFASWVGDKYSFDEGMCYLLWWEGDRIELLTARCDRGEPAIRCRMTDGNQESLDCSACNELGECVDCSSRQAVTDCVSAGARKLAAGNGPARGRGGASGGEAGSSEAGNGGASSGRAGLGGTGPDGTSGQAGASSAGRNAALGGDAAGAGSVTLTVEWSLCIDQVSQLARRAQSCSLPEMLDADLLCRDRLSDVNLCLVAVEAASLFGSSCAVLGEDLACGRLFP